MELEHQLVAAGHQLVLHRLLKVYDDTRVGWHLAIHAHADPGDAFTVHRDMTLFRRVHRVGQIDDYAVRPIHGAQLRSHFAVGGDLDADTIVGANHVQPLE